MEAKCADVEVDLMCGEAKKETETKSNVQETEQHINANESKVSNCASETPPINGPAKQLSREEEESWRKSGYIGRIELTEDDKLLHRAVAFSYQVIIHHIDEFVLRHVETFENVWNTSGTVAVPGEEVEHRLEWTNIHKEYEQLMEAKLEAFCKKEKVSVGDLYLSLKRAGESNRRSQKMVGMLLAATEYSRFIRLMRRRVKRIIDERSTDGANGGDGSSSEEGTNSGTREGKDSAGR